MAIVWKMDCRGRDESRVTCFIAVSLAQDLTVDKHVLNQVTNGWQGKMGCLRLPTFPLEIKRQEKGLPWWRSG